MPTKVLKYWQLMSVVLVLVLGLLLMAYSEEGRTRDALLQQTPMGSSFEDVQVYCVKNSLKCAQSSTAGYLNQDTGKTVGVRSIWAVVKERSYNPFMKTSISVFWGFDQDGKLLDIWVWKTTDAP